MSFTNAFAQLFIDKNGMTIINGTILSVDGLALTPDNNLTLSVNLLQKSDVPISIKSKQTINKVYRFTYPVKFTGKALIGFKLTELNVNVKNNRQIAHASIESQGFTILAGSTVNNDNQVFNSFTNLTLRVITAIEVSSALPVRLIDFTANKESQTTILKWSTSLETNADRFEIEHSSDTKSWKNIGEINAVGESRETNDYQYTHTEIADGLNYYRLKMVDNDGTFAYSTIKSVTFSLPDAITIFPNPASERLQLNNVSKSKVTRVVIYDKAGQLRYENAAFPETGIELGNLAPGSYILVVNQENGRRVSRSFLKL